MLMQTDPMEHLLNGAAAVEEKSKSTDETSSSAEVTTESCMMKNESLPTTLPKLPPISSLTSLRNGRPPAYSQTTVATAPVPVAPAPAPRPPTTTMATHDEGRCRYRNKLCMHPRALKRNGELHNLCEKHRAKANQNQRKLESKRRVQKRQTRQVMAASVPSRTYPLTPAVPSSAMPSHPQYQPHPTGLLPSLTQLARPPPPPQSMSGSSPAPGYPYYENNQYPPYSR